MKYEIEWLDREPETLECDVLPRRGTGDAASTVEFWRYGEAYESQAAPGKMVRPEVLVLMVNPQAVKSIRLLEPSEVRR